MIELNKLASQIYEGNAEKGFWDGSSKDVKDKKEVALKLMLIVSELGEAMESHRKGKFANIEMYKHDMEVFPASFTDNFVDRIKDSFEDEIADTIIRLFDMAGGLGIDLEFHIEIKLKYNATREKLHGKKY